MLTTEEFIEEAIKIHNNKYDYSKVRYTKKKSKVIIICNKHGEFEQAPYNHLRGSGCFQCAVDLMRYTVDDFIQKSRDIHNNKYDYSEVEYLNLKHKVSIICPIHGLFIQSPYDHIHGCGCIKCGIDKLTMSKSEFLNRAIIIHGDTYDYSKVDYKNCNNIVTIICPKHGSFEQIPRNHLRGAGCWRCQPGFKLDTAGFIEKARNIHGDRYDYSLVDYTGAYNKVVIICPEHGVFNQIATIHLGGSNCPICVGRKRYTTETFVAEAIRRFGNKYDYSKVEYKHSNIDIIIICPKHGEFKQRPAAHLCGHVGCTFCYTYTGDDFIKKAIDTHSTRYDYSKVNYINTDTKVTIICKQHGEFQQIPFNHLAGCNCPRCVNSISENHAEIVEYIKSLGNFNMDINTRSIIYPYELDIYLDKYKLAIEHHGLFYHSYNQAESTIQKYKHRNKHKACSDLNIKLLQIFSNEWKDHTKQEIIKSKIRTILGLGTVIYARKCQIINIDSDAYRDFTLQYHLQGYRGASVKFGLVYNGNVVSIMSFGKHPKYEWEIIRFVSSNGLIVLGGGSRLFQRFIQTYNPRQLLSYADCRYSNGDIYRKFGMREDGITKPNYYYICGTRLFSRQNFQKHKLSKLPNFDPNSSESQNMFNNNYRRIWDAGHYRFLLR